MTKRLLTFPSAQSVIKSKGNSARYMAVVLHHIGSPNSTTTTQKETITDRLRRWLSLVSGGGLRIGEAGSTVVDGGTGSLLSSLGVAVASTPSVGAISQWCRLVELPSHLGTELR